MAAPEIRVTGTLETTVGPQSIPLEIAYTDDNINGVGTALVYVHGWGCNKSDFAGAGQDPLLAARRRLSFDFPGHGDSPYPPGYMLTVDSLVEVLHDLTLATGLGHFALAGHSVGGLVAIRYVTRYPERIAGLVNVVGNMTANDCFMTGEVAAGRETKESLQARFKESANPGFQRYASQLGIVNEAAYRALAASAVRECGSATAFKEFTSLRVPTLFMYGAESVGTLDYLDELAHRGVDLYEIPRTDHFPAIDNPQDFYAALGGFMGHVDAQNRPRVH